MRSGTEEAGENDVQALVWACFGLCLGVCPGSKLSGGPSAVARGRYRTRSRCSLERITKEVKLVFSVEPGGLIPDQSLFWVVRQGPDEVVAVGRVDLTVADRNVMRAELKERLVPGVYLVKWVAISLQDKGFAEGSYSFAVR